jgi:hypothetical protein
MQRRLSACQKSLQSCEKKGSGIKDQGSGEVFSISGDMENEKNKPDREDLIQNRLSNGNPGYRLSSAIAW